MSIAKRGPELLNGGRVKGVSYLNDEGRMSPSKAMCCDTSRGVLSERSSDMSFDVAPCPICRVPLIPRMGRRGPIIPCRCHPYGCRDWEE